NAEARRDRGRGVRGAKNVVFAFGALGETGESAALAERADPVAAAGDDLVRISLVANVPHDLVARGIENVMERDGEFDDAEARTEMAARHGHRVDRFLSQLVGKLLQLRRLKLAQIGGNFDLVEQRRFYGHGKSSIALERLADLHNAIGRRNANRLPAFMLSAKNRPMQPSPVMAGLVPAIHVFSGSPSRKAWMPGTRPGMTSIVT